MGMFDDGSIAEDQGENADYCSVGDIELYSVGFIGCGIPGEHYYGIAPFVVRSFVYLVDF